MATPTVNFSSVPLPIFIGENYDFWSLKLKTYFVSQKLWDIVKNGISIPSDTSTLSEAECKNLEEKQQKDAQALFVIQQAVGETIFTRITDADTAKKAWDILEEEFRGTEKVRSIKLHYLRREYENLKMMDSETIEEYYTRIKEVVNQMKLYGENVTDKKLVDKILITVTEKYDPIVAAIEQAKDLSTLSITELVGSLEAYEKKLKRCNDETVENVFQTKVNLRSQKSKSEGRRSNQSSKEGGASKVKETHKGVKKQGESRGKYPPCGVCKKRSHLEKDCWFQGKPQCNNCKRFGHIAKDCRSKNTHQANYVEESNKDESLFFTSQSSSEKTQDTWFLDSGCSNHMTPYKDIFSKLDTTFQSKVRLGNDDFLEVKGMGTVAVQTLKGTRYINNVLLVPNLAQNLLSVGQMMQRGYILHFEGETCTIYDNKDKNLIMARVKMRNCRDFPIRWKYDIAMKVQADDSWLWHRRFGHFNYQGLNFLHQKNMMRDLPKIQEAEEACEGCLLGKQHRQPFPSRKSWRAKNALELVHTDVCGPMRTPSHHQNRYFILFIDDYTRMTWVYFMREKSEVFKIFKKFKLLVEKQSGYHIKTLRSDRGKEYTSTEFDKFCEEEGVERQLTVGYTPEQNGVSERKNRTVMEMARSMLKEKGLPNTFWAEAVYTAVYLLNRCPTKAVQDKTPVEAWSGRKPSAKHLKVFGCICYVHIPNQK